MSLDNKALEQYLMIKGFITMQPPEDQEKIQECVKAIKNAMGAFKPEHGAMAMALVGGEMAAKNDLI